MRYISSSSILAAVFLSASALAADWALVVESSSGSTYSVDKGSMRTMPNGYKRAWLWTIYGQAKNTGTTSYKAYSEVDCQNGRMRDLQTLYYKGEQLNSSNYEPESWVYVAPDTVQEAVFDYICFGK